MSCKQVLSGMYTYTKRAPANMHTVGHGYPYPCTWAHVYPCGSARTSNWKLANVSNIKLHLGFNNAN